MDSIECSECGLSFCSRYNVLRHKRIKHQNLPSAPRAYPGSCSRKLHGAQPQRAHLEGAQDAPSPGVHLEGAHRAPPQGAHLEGAQGAPPPRAHLESAHRAPPQGAHLEGAQGAPPPGTYLEGAHRAPPQGAHLEGAQGAPPPRAHLEGAHRAPPQGAHLEGAQGAPPPGTYLEGAHRAPPQGAHLEGAQGAPPPGAHLEGAHRAPPQGAHLEGVQGTPWPSCQDDGMSTTEIKLMVLHHPFTMMISGPTGCGKTTFAMELLQHQSTRIQPQIYRIVWLYRRWQRMYAIIKTSVTPKVEFIQGIPVDLEDDEFFDPRFNNLLILDDLFSEAGKDKRITDLFTEGSHHRSLSVISINQNLFGNKDPTQRRNCHYLVLFNNPVDCQSTMTLARQMYPGNSAKFLKMFEKGTKHPYGYLLVDLKPFTPKNDRLKYDVTWPDQQVAVKKPQHSVENQSDDVTLAIKAGIVPEVHHSSIGVQTGHITENSEQDDIMAEKGQACDDCGLLFDTVHDVQRHVKSGWCPENVHSPKKRKLDDMDEWCSENVSPPKKRKLDLNMDSDQGESVEDNESYQILWKRAKVSGEGKFERMVDQFVSNGETESDAEELAQERMEPYNKREFFKLYEQLLDYIVMLKKNAIHERILRDIYILMEKGNNQASAVKRILKRYSHEFEDLFDMSGEEDSEEGSEAESEGDESDQ